MAFKLGFQQIALTYSTSKYILNVNMKFNLDLKQMYVSYLYWHTIVRMINL